MTTLHSRNGNCVAALQPALGDLFVVTLLGGKVALVRSEHEYEAVLNLAIAFADATPPPEDGPFTIKVHGASLDELLLLKGMQREDLAADIDEDDASWRELALRTCREVLRDSSDAAARRDAYELLVGLGALS